MVVAARAGHKVAHSCTFPLHFTYSSDVQSTSFLAGHRANAPAYTYAEFRALLGTLAAERRTTGPDQNAGPYPLHRPEPGRTSTRAYAVPLLPALVEKLRSCPPRAVAGAGRSLVRRHGPHPAHAGPPGRRKRRPRTPARAAALRPPRADGHAPDQRQEQHPQTHSAAMPLPAPSWRLGPAPGRCPGAEHELHADKALHINQIVKTMNAWYEADNGQAMQQELLAQLG